MAETGVLIVDDEPLARAVIRDLLAGLDGLTVVGECRNGLEAVDAVRALDPQLMFLDIQMPDLDGFGVLRALLPDRSPAVVLVTAYDEFAVQAFEAEALDFVVKPFTDDRFYRALDRARRRLGTRREMEELSRGLAAALQRLQAAADATEPVAYRSRFLVSSGRRSVCLPVGAVTWIEADDYYARIHVEGASYLLRESLAELERELDPRTFIRVHRSAIANVGSVREVRRDATGRRTVVLADGTRLMVSERRRGSVLRALEGVPDISRGSGAPR